MTPLSFVASHKRWTSRARTPRWPRSLEVRRALRVQVGAVGSPARALLANSCRPASCQVASWSCSSPPLYHSLPGEGLASLIESAPPAPRLPCTARFPSDLRRGSPKEPRLKAQGLDHKEVYNSTGKSAKAMTGPVFASCDIIGLG